MADELADEVRRIWRQWTAGDGTVAVPLAEAQLLLLIDYLRPFGRGLGNTPRSGTGMARARTRGTGAFTDTAPELRTVVAPEGGDDMVKAQAWFEDKVVRAIRAEGYCSEALRIMDKVFGGPLDTVGVYDTRGRYGEGRGSKGEGQLFLAYLDSNGADCWNNVWRNKDGYDRNGFNMAGVDKDGFNKAGIGKDGFNREGKDANGVHRDDPARFAYDGLGRDAEGYNAEGYDQFGFNREGFNRQGRPRGVDRFVFDASGYDKDGFDRAGNSRTGEFSAAASDKYRLLRRGLI